eukprot:278672_1
MSNKKSEQKQPNTQDEFVWEFGGIIGATFMIIGLPIGTFYLTACAFYGHLLLPSSLSIESLEKDALTPLLKFISNQCSIDLMSFKIYTFWFLIQVILDRILSGEIVNGQPIPELKNKRLKYKMNGWKAWISTHIILFSLLIYYKNITTLIVDRLYSIMVVAQIYAIVISILSYIIGYMSNLGCRLSGSFIYDFWMGYARVPRIGEFDIKLFCEARPGLQLWIVIDFILFYNHYLNFGVIDWQMFVIFLMQWIYITDYFWFEDAILTTMDLIHDKFGFMLSFGDIVWVPWTYSLQIQCLYFYYKRNPKHPKLDLLNNTRTGQDIVLWTWLTVIFMIFIIGYLIFRQSNIQKHRFRFKHTGSEILSDNKIWGKDIEYIQTKRGTKLLVSGWWGICRHMNYTGDWLMSMAQSLCCDNFTFCVLPSSILTYFNPIYFAILLIHRERRDNLRCKMKYGNDWDIYCERVKYRMIPYIY